ncbi:ATP-binding cassette domain-containing protein [Escherichia coli]
MLVTSPAIIGPNGCGKSTLLRTLSRLMTPAHGHVWLDGEHIRRFASDKFARRIGLFAQMLPRRAISPCRSWLAARGRYPHQPLFTRWRKEDEEAVTKAMQATEITHLANQSVDTLSGGATPARVDRDGAGGNGDPAARRSPRPGWISGHQINLLELLSELNREKGYTLAAVLHNLNQACRYASHLIALRGRENCCSGSTRRRLSLLN